MENHSDRKVTFYYGLDVTFVSSFSSGLAMEFNNPLTITGFKIEEIENPQSPEYRFKHLSEEPIG